MTTTTLPLTPAEAPETTSDASRARGVGRVLREHAVFFGAAAAVMLHVADDNFLQPPDGTSATDHLVSGLVPLALLALAAWAYPRVRAGAAAAIALTLGFFGLVFGLIEAGYYTLEVGPSGDDYTGFLAGAAGLVLVGLGLRPALAVPSVRRSLVPQVRATDAARRRCCLVAYFVVLPVAFAYLIAHVAVATVPPRTSARRTRTSPSPPATASTSRAGTSRRRTAPRSSPSTAGPRRSRTPGCWHGTATAC